MLLFAHIDNHERRLRRIDPHLPVVGRLELDDMARRGAVTEGQIVYIGAPRVVPWLKGSIELVISPILLLPR